MAITLPDFTALPQVTPQAGGNLPQYPASDPGAAALGELGKGVSAAGGALVDVAAYKDIAQTRQDRAAADAAFSNRTIPLTEQLKYETDPDKIAGLKGQYQTALEESGQAIGNPLAREYWMNSHGHVVAQGQADADHRTYLVAQDKNKADLLGQAFDSSKNGMTGDPAAFDIGMHNIENIFQTGTANGTFSAVEGQQHLQEAKANMIVGRADYLDATGHPDQATAFLQQYGTQVPPHILDQRTERYRERNKTVGGENLADRSANATAGGAPPGGDTQDTLQADFAKKSGAFGTPEQAGSNLSTVTAPGGAAFQVHKLAAPQVQGFINELEQGGYKIDPATSGGYNNRNKVGVNSDEKSEHAFGTAIDINTARNKQADTLITDLPSNVGQIAAKWGLKWGGTFEGKKDAMHFEVARLLPGGAPASATGGAPDRVDNWETQNNNFGGIRKTGADPNATTAQGGFETYPTPEAGVQAIADNLRRYAAGGVVTEMNPEGKPLNTIRGIVSTWAPPSQNDTNALINRASRVTGFKPDQTIDLKDPATMGKVIEATIRNEQGGKLPVAPAIITKVAGAVPSSGGAGPPPAALGGGGDEGGGGADQGDGGDQAAPPADTGVPLSGGSTPPAPQAGPTAGALPPGTPDAVSASQAARQQTINLEADFQRRLKFIEADPTSTQDQKDVASRIVTGQYNRAKAAISDQSRKEAAAVKYLMKDDEASIISGGVPIAQLTTDRVRNALGEDEAERFAQQRSAQLGYYNNFHDMPNLTQGEIDQRLAETKPALGSPGFAPNQQLYDFAHKNAEALRKQRIVDPAGSVSTLADVQVAAQDATLERPETFLPLVQARTLAMERVGIPAQNQVPLTNAEALELWKPVGLASEGGNIREIRASLTDVIQRLQVATGDKSAMALEAVLRAGHASHDTALTAASVLKKLSVGEKPTQAETRAFDDAAKDAAARAAAAPLYPDPMTGIPYAPAGAQPTVAPAPPKVTFPAADDEALQMLQAQPALADRFNAIYGPGAAEKVLRTARPPPVAPAPAQAQP